MPDVGVLQLEIRDNSTEAGQGLGLLASALSKVQKAIGTKGIDFQSIATGVTALKDSAQGSEKAITSISSLFNALANFGRVKDLKLDKIASAFTEIKDAVGSGFNIGNAGYNLNQMRLAFSGDWGNAADAEGKINGAISGMHAIKVAGEEFKSADTAGTIRDVANAISELSNSTGTIGSGGAHDLYQMLGASSTDGFRDLGYNSALGMEDGIQKGTARVAQAAEDMTYAAMDSVAETQQSHSPALEFVKLGEYAGEGYAEGIKNKIADAIKIASEFTTSIIASAKDNAPAAAKQAAEFTQGIVTGVLGNVNLPETQKAVIGQALTVASDFTKSIVENSKGNIEQAAKIAGDFTQSILSKTIGDALSNGMNGDALKSDIAETGKGFAEAEKVFKNVGETIEETKNSIEDMSSSFSNAKTSVGATLKEFDGLEKNKSFRSYMYGPRNDISISGMGFQPGYVTDEERMAKNPQWYNPEEFYERIASAATKAKDPVSDLNETIQQSQNAPAADPNISYIDNLIKNSSNIDLLNMRLESMTDRLYEGATSGQMTGEQIANMVSQTQALKKEIAGLSGSNFNLGLSFKDLKAGIQKMFPTLSQMVKRLGTIAKYRFIRSIIKHITSGFNEGLKNMYEYSKLVGGTFAPAMDSAASAIATMKNSLGAALAPAIQAVIPYVTQLVNWFIQGVNWANQLFALLGGQNTWTRALPATVNAFDKQKKAAKGAGAAIKDLLADWDELNIIQSESGSGGGGSAQAAEDYLKMFEEVGRFDNRVKDVVNFVKDNFDTIKSLAAGIGAAILAWKLSKAFDQSLGFLRTLEIATGITLLVNGVKLTTAAGYDIGKNGINSDNLLNAVGGVFETALGTGLVGVAFGGITGGVLGLTVGTSIALLALAASMDEGEKDKLYGDIQLTADDIQEEVDKLFTFDVNAALSNAQVDHETLTNAQTDVQKALTEANADFVTFKMKLTPESALELLSSVNKVVDQTNALLKIFQKNISVGFGFDVNYDDPKLAQKFSTDNITGLEGYITKLGNSIGQILQDGIVDSIEEQAILDDLMGKLSRVSEAIALGEASGRFTSELEKGNYGRDWTSVDRQSLIDYANKYKEQLRLTEEAGYLQAKDTKASLGGIYYGMLQREADNPGTYTAAKLEEAKLAYKKYNVDDVTKKFVDDATADGRKIFIENMMTAFGSAIEKLNESGIRTDLLTKGPGGLAEGKIGLEEWIESVLAMNLGWDKNDFGDILDVMGISGLDMLSEKIKSQYISRIIQTLGRESDTYTRLKDELKIPVDEILSIDKASWDGWTSKTQKNYITALSKAYGGREVIEGFKRAGYTADQLMGVIGQFSGSSKDSLVKAIEDVYGGVITTVQNDVAKETKNDNPMSWLDILGLSFQAPTEEEKKIIEKADFERAVKNDNPMGWLDFLGISYQPPETPVDVPVNINIEPIVDSDELYQQIREKILNSDMPDTSVPLEQTFELWQNDEQEVLQELRNRIDKFGIDQAFDMLTNFLNGQDWTLGKVPDMKRASVPNYVPQTNGAFLNGTETVKTEPADPTREAENVETGVRNGNKNLEGLIRDLIAATDRAGNRPITVSLFPSSGWGNTNRQSEKKMEEVTGYNG